jgi:hypothetical protein
MALVGVNDMVRADAGGVTTSFSVPVPEPHAIKPKLKINTATNLMEFIL